MNRTAIDWTDFTWNPVTGCEHGCWYCYARKMCQRFPKLFPNGFKPTFHPERLSEPWHHRKCSRIFVCSISDLFASWTKPEWRDAVLLSIWGCPVKHTFQLLTKNPELIPDRKYPENVWIGTTVTNLDGDWRNIERIKKVRAAVRFVSFEPLLAPFPFDVDLNGLQWIIIGKLTGSRRVKLNPQWVQHILELALSWHIPVFVKNNIVDEYLEFDKFNQFPVLRSKA